MFKCNSQKVPMKRKVWEDGNLYHAQQTWSLPEHMGKRILNWQIFTENEPVNQSNLNPGSVHWSAPADLSPFLIAEGSF